MALARASVLDVGKAVAYNTAHGIDTEDSLLLRAIADRKYQVQPEMDEFAQLCDRWDRLYFPEDVLAHAGASHWADHQSATTKGRTHISLNIPPVYVDVPASLQSVTPVENMVSTLSDDGARALAAMTERIYFAWKDEEHYDLKCHQACVTKGLYGRTAFKVYWDDDKNRPCVTVIDQPRNLYLGWASNEYTRLNWALYVYRLTPEQVYEDFGLETEEVEAEGGGTMPYIVPADREFHRPTSRRWSGMTMEVEVYDYWYRKPKEGQTKRDGYGHVEMETWNAIFVGNVMVKNERHAEYDGKMPYVVLMNTYIPGVPNGRPELYDIESLIREKDERLSAGGQMLTKTVDGQYWQLVGPEAPDVVPQAAMPKPNKVAAPGAGNRVEKIEPWMPEFQLETFLTRLDRELADVSGLNDLLRGMAPQTVLSSSKAITALVANYEARIRIKRDLFYKARREVWELAAAVWAKKTPALKPVLVGAARLEQTAPSLTPRDDMETAAMAGNLVNSKMWSLARGMDRTGVDDPESEQDVIRAERTDASLFPESVQIMAQLMTVLQSLGFGTPPSAQAQLDQQSQSLAGFRQMLGGGQGVPMLNSAEEQEQLPPTAMPQPAQGLPPGGTELESQVMVQGGETQGRLVQQTPIIEGQ